MGVNQFGIPKEEVRFLKSLYNLDVFVEGGTYKGGTAKEMSRLFDHVITIENSKEMYEQAKINLAQYDNITLIKGDTRTALPEIIKEHSQILYWLDSHWSGGETYGKEDECPLIEELDLIFNQGGSPVILIDDARLFLSPPPKPHDLNQWPTLLDIMDFLPKGWDVLENEDVLYVLDKDKSRNFREFLQQQITKRYELQSSRSLLKKIVQKLGLCG